jgi:hypothetical protein
LLLIFGYSFQHTAFHDAAGNGHTAVCELLIAGKSDVNAKNKFAFFFESVTVFVLYCVFETWFLFSALVTEAPLCMKLPVMVRRHYASC